MLLLAACTVQQTVPEPVSAPDLRLPALIAERNDVFQSLRSLARISYRASGTRGGFDAAVMVRRPHRLRLEAFSLFGAALILTVDDGAVTGFLPARGQFYRAGTTRQNLFRATQMLLDLHELAALMMGLPPVDANAAWDVGARALKHAHPDGSTDILTFDAEVTAPIRWQRLGPSGKPWYTATFEDFSDTPFGRFPRQITLATPPLQRSYRIRYDDPEINVTLPETYFIQDLPEDAVRVPLPLPTG